MHTLRQCYTFRIIEREPQDFEGGLWRDVVNFLGSPPVEPAIYLPLLHRMLAR